MVISKTPLRISFFGGGTDYPLWYKEHGGAVLSTTIDKYHYITVRHLPPFFDYRIKVVWSKVENIDDIEEITHPSVRETLRFLKIGQDMAVHYDGDLPARTGMGSSSAFTVGLLNALYALQKREVTKQQLALDAIHVEQNLIRENVGSQDQVAAAFGGLNKVEFGGKEEIRVIPIQIPVERLRLLESHMMLFFTGFSRTASEVAADQIKNTPAKARELSTMRTMVDEALGILENPKCRFSDFGKLLNESWQVKRTLSSKITNDSIDEIYSKALRAGAIGGKLLGAGGGGFMLIFAEPEAQPLIKKSLGNLLYVPFEFENQGSHIVHRTLA